MTPTEAQIEALIKALEPFAKIEIPPEASDGMWVAKTLYCNNQITAFQVRQARAACNAKIAFDAAAEAGEPKTIKPRNPMVECAVQEAIAATIERCAQVVAGEIYKEHYRKWPSISTVGNRANNDEITMHCDRLAAAIRALKDQS